jgi:glycosyltransferase involved in cell wall biosynthesis
LKRKILKVRIATVGTYPHGLARAYRIHCYAKSLIDQGVKVDILTTKSNFDESKNRLNIKGEFQGVPFINILNFKSRSTFLSFVLNELSTFFLHIHLLLKAKEYDVVLLYGGGLIPNIIFIPFLKLLNKKVYLELNEFPYSTAGNTYTSVKWIRKIMVFFYLRVHLPLFNGVICISDNLMNIVKQYSPKMPNINVPILILNNEYKIEEKKSEKYIFHAGTLNEKKDGIISVFKAYVNAANRLKNEHNIDLLFYITNKNTDIKTWNSIIEIFKKANMESNLIITGYLDETSLHTYLANATLLVINKPDTFQNRFNFPTKFGDYLLSKRPVIVSVEHGQIKKYLTNNINSIVIEKENIDEMASSIYDLVCDPVKADMIGQNGYKTAVDFFYYKQYGQALKNFLKA